MMVATKRSVFVLKEASKDVVVKQKTSVSQTLAGKMPENTIKDQELVNYHIKLH